MLPMCAVYRSATYGFSISTDCFFTFLSTVLLGCSGETLEERKFISHLSCHFINKRFPFCSRINSPGCFSFFFAHRRSSLRFDRIFQEWIGRPVVCNSWQNCNSHHDANAKVSFKFRLGNITPLLKSTLVFGQFLPRDSVRLGYHQVNCVFSKQQCEEEQSFWSVWDFYFNPRESCIECFNIKIFEDFTPLAFFFDIRVAIFTLTFFFRGITVDF